MSKFYIGQVVQLNSGGAPMTITENRSDGVVKAVWTDNDGVPQEINAEQDCFFAIQK